MLCSDYCMSVSLYSLFFLDHLFAARRSLAIIRAALTYPCICCCVCLQHTLLLWLAARLLFSLIRRCTRSQLDISNIIQSLLLFINNSSYGFGPVEVSIVSDKLGPSLQKEAGVKGEVLKWESPHLVWLCRFKARCVDLVAPYSHMYSRHWFFCVPC